MNAKWYKASIIVSSVSKLSSIFESSCKYNGECIERHAEHCFLSLEGWKSTVKAKGVIEAEQGSIILFNTYFLFLNVPKSILIFENQIQWPKSWSREERLYVSKSCKYQRFYSLLKAF